MRILVTGGEFVNKGAEAMVRTVQAELGKHIDDVRFYFPPILMFPGTESLREAAGIGLLHAPASRGEQIQSLLRMTGRHIALPLHAMVARGTSYACVLERIDGVIDISGYAYGDTWGTKYAVRVWDYVRYCKILKIPYMFLPQAFGPFDREDCFGIYQRLFSNASLLYARDAVSQESLSRVLGCRQEDVALCPDIAFRFQGAPPEIGRGILAQLGVSSLEVIGISPNQRIYERTLGTGLENKYVTLLAALCKHIRSRGAAVVLLPHEVEATDNGSFDDRLLCSLIAGAARDPKVVAVTRRHNAAELKSIIGQCHFLLGSRFHALVAALSQGIPAGSLSWSHKYRELLRPFEMQDCVIGHEDVDIDKAKNLVETLFEKRNVFHKCISERLPEIKNQVDELFERISTVLVRRPKE